MRPLLANAGLAACFVLAGCTAPAGGDPAAAGSGETTPPNVILFLVDDLGWQDLSVALHEERTGFNDRYRTPHVARMARAGLAFTQAYAASPVCTPTRTSILRGQHPARTRISDWTLHADRDFSRPMPPLEDPPWRKEGLAPGPHLLPEMLRARGYRTIHVGKAHFGAIGTPGADPLRLGFDRNVAGHAAGAPGSYHGRSDYGGRRGGPWAVPGLEQYHGSDVFLTEALTREAEREIEDAVAAGRPFFLNMAHYAVHTPIQSDERFVQRYLDAGLDEAEARYAALVEGVDASLGRLWAKLEELGTARNTLLIFFSDNGGLTAHSRGATPAGTGHGTHNAPLRSGKGSGYEGGIRVPLIMCWAGGAHPGLPLPAGARAGQPVLSTDLYVTILELAGVVPERIDAAEPDGRSLLPLLRGERSLPPVGAGRPEARERALAWHYPHKWGPQGDRYEPFTALRHGDWKILYWYESREWELYDLGTDLGERHDLAQERPEKLRAMQERLRAWMRETDAQRPSDQSSGRMLPLPPARPVSAGSARRPG